MTLKSILYTPSASPSSPPTLQVLDQLQLPHATVYTDVPNAATAFEVIKDMRVRGAPAIALVAALSLAVQAHPSQSAPLLKGEETVPDTVDDTRAWFKAQLDYLVTSRPTAVNLREAAERLYSEVIQSKENARGGARELRLRYVAAAEKMLEDDVRDNENIGRHGSEWIRQRAVRNGVEQQQVSVLTHCNTGSLATAGYGTALGIVRSLHGAGSLRRCYYTETRPYNQGSRLTGYELLHDDIPATLITDSMAGALFKRKAADENIVAVVVGADRVAANGDTANKIGTYGLAVLAREHGIKFLVAAPRTTIDLATKSGEDIEIEERPQVEMLQVKGPRALGYADGRQQVDMNHVEAVSTAALGTQAWNPAFDVTPAALIDGIVTEVGVVERVDGAFDLASIFSRKAAVDQTHDGNKGMPSPSKGP